MTSVAEHAAGSAVERLDRLPLSRFHWRLLLVSGIGWLFDAMDILIVGSVVAAVSREWGLDATEAQWINTANLAGLFFGALASGQYDRWKQFAETCMAEYDLDGWKAKDLINTGGLSALR